MDPIFYLMLHCVPHLGEKAISSILRACGPDGLPLERFFQETEDAYERSFSLHRRSIDHLVHGRQLIRQEARQLLNELGQQGVTLVTPRDQGYPARFAPAMETSPPLLYMKGDHTLLAGRTAAVVSSTGTSPEGLAAALQAARTLIAAGFTLVTGRYRGVYNLSYRASVDAGRPAIVVLDRGILAEPKDHKGTPHCRDLELSIFRPRESWIEHKSARRDQLIVALSDVIVAVDLRPGGKIDRECRRALRQGRRVLLCMGQGNQSSLLHLIEAGAKTFNADGLPDELLRALEG